jgi:hypothetical protein
LSAVVTGSSPSPGVVVTAAAALLATWMKYKTDRRQVRRKERRELYARFQHASAQIWDALFRVVPEENAVPPSDDAVRAVNESWIAWAKTWMEMSIVASDEVWRITEPLFEEFRSAYSHRRLPSENHEDALREQMRRELGR